MKTTIIILFVLSAGCSKGSSTDAASSKGLFSTWTANISGLVIDLTQASYGVNSSVFIFANGARCSITVSITDDGDHVSGNYSVTNSAYVNGTGLGSDPGCASLNQTGGYSVSANTLQLCALGGPSCIYYH